MGQTQMSLPGLRPEFHLGDKLRKAREVAGLTQTQLADEIGIARNSVGRYEGGDYTPPRPVIVAWALRTGVELSWLTEGDEAAKRSHIRALMRPAEPQEAPGTAEIKAMRKALGHDVRTVSRRGARLS